MSDSLFSGLERLGLGDMSDMDVYEEEKKEEKQEQPKTHEIREEDILYDKNYRCPLCDQTFKQKTIRTGKNKLIGTDSDLRARYSIADPVKYDCVVCVHCGYAALTRFFSHASDKQLQMIKETISSKFKGVDETAVTYSYDEAFIRYQLVLANAVVKKASESERAYICLKMAWLLRGKAESLPDDMEEIEGARASLKMQEKQFIEKAYQGFKIAMQKEPFPICGMEEYTFLILVADLGRQCKDYTVSLKLVSDIITSKTVSPKIKDKARDLKELIKEEVGKK